MPPTRHREKAHARQWIISLNEIIFMAMDLRWLQTFVMVAERGSLIGAARQLDVSPPSVTRAIASLEAHVGVQLFTRTTRSVKLTEPGERFLAEVRTILAALDSAVVDAAGDRETARGQLTVTASVTFGRTHVADVLLEYLHEHPRVSASLLLLDRVTNMIDEGIDVAVRIGELPDSSLLARKVGFVRRVLVASPDYLARRGIPKHPRELAEHDMLAFTGLMPARKWRYREGKGAASKACEVALMPTLEVNDALVAMRAAERGHGITLALSYMVADALAAGSLVLVLEPFALPPIPVQLVIPESRVVSAKVRSFLDFAAERLAERLGAESSKPRPRRR
jgi:DNA-binding transcriptional LysR family regulator